MSEVHNIISANLHRNSVRLSKAYQEALGFIHGHSESGVFVLDCYIILTLQDHLWAQESSLGSELCWKV